MNTTTTIRRRFILDPYKSPASRHKCPQCGHNGEFTRYVNTETGEHLPDHVGRCNREGRCGYHYSANAYLKENGISFRPPQQIEKLLEPEKVDYMPSQYILQSMKGFDQSNFAIYLKNLFGDEITRKAMESYCVGRSKADQGKACIFWNVDNEYKVRTGKVICYNPDTGKRVKEIKPFMVHLAHDKNFKAKLTFFGAHLLSQFPDKAIGIVESEKTAIIASIYMPEMIWLATGGASGCKWREYSVHKDLANRNIVMYPDFGLFNKQSNKTCYNEWKERADCISERMSCKIKVSNVLELNIQESERVNDYDLADMLVKRKGNIGWALTDDISECLHGYPVMWDLYNNN